MTSLHAAASRAAAAFACLVLATSAPAQGTAAPAKPAQVAKPAAKAAKPPRVPLLVEPRAIDLIKAASARLAAAKAMSFTAIVDIEYPSKLGPPLAYPVRYDVAMQRPDKLRVVQNGAGAANEFYFDGKLMMAYVPEAHLVAVADAPPTIEAALKMASDKAAIYYPFMDLLLPDPYAVMTNKVLHAFYIGPSGAVGGVPTEAVAWATNDVFIQMWVGTEDKLPRRIRAMFANDPLKLRHDMQLSNWQIDLSHAADTFASATAQTALRIPFAKPLAVPPPPGSKPAPKAAKPTNAAPSPKTP
jgi:hypothetical protein